MDRNLELFNPFTFRDIYRLAFQYMDNEKDTGCNRKPFEMNSLSRFSLGLSSRGLIAMGFFFFTTQHSFPDTVPSLASVLEPIRAKYQIPALAGAIFTTDGVVEMAAVGVRKSGATVPVTSDDLWHLGSDTKAMTATLAGTFVAAKKLSWDAKVVSFFPEIADRVPAVMKSVTLGQVLAHQAGLVENLDWNALSKRGSMTERRLAAAQAALTAPAYAPGTFRYSNTDYVVVGAILEKISGKSWEDLMRERLFAPLGMGSAGFGGTGTVGQIDQPWPHLESGVPMPINGPSVDNPEVMGPAGTVHCPMKDWAKFLVDQLRGGTGEEALLPNEIYQAMQTAAPPSNYAYGWGVTSRPWAGGKAVTHAGSNTMNFAVCWLAPARKFGVLVCCNRGGDIAGKACDAAASALIQRYLASAKN
jgi:CubicO group peptidase (beta-lactamase class C family)